MKQRLKKKTCQKLKQNLIFMLLIIDFFIKNLIRTKQRNWKIMLVKIFALV